MKEYSSSEIKKYLEKNKRGKKIRMKGENKYKFFLFNSVNLKPSPPHLDTSLRDISSFQINCISRN